MRFHFEHADIDPGALQEALRLRGVETSVHRIDAGDLGPCVLVDVRSDMPRAASKTAVRTTCKALGLTFRRLEPVVYCWLTEPLP